MASPRRDAAIGVATTALALAAMAVDHLIGDDPGLEDPPAFFISAGVTVAAALGVFGLVVPSTRRHAAAPDAAARRGLVLGVVAVLSLPVTLWLGLPFPLAGGAIALALLGRAGPRRRAAIAAIAVGAVVIALATAGYVVEAVGKLS